MSFLAPACGAISHEVPNERRNLKWSCYPIVTWCKIIGIPLDFTAQPNNNLAYWCKICMSLFLFLINISNNVIIVVFALILFINSSFPRFELYSQTFLWNHMIDRLNYSFVTFGTHFGLLASTFVKWPAFVRAFQNLERDLKLSSNDYKKLRFTSIVGVVFAVLV